MIGKLTVKEVAKLLNISAHTIRYYDKEGLLTKEQDQNNGYRLFSLDDVTRLSNVLILRESGISIKDIKALIEDYSKDKYSDCLRESLKHLDQEEKKIKESKAMLLRTLKHLEEENKSFKRCEYPDRHLHEIRQMTYTDSYNQQLVESLKGLENYSFINNDLVYTLYDHRMIVSFESLEESTSKITHGEFLEYHINIQKDEDITRGIDELMAYAYSHNIALDEQVFLSVTTQAMLVADFGYKAKLSCRIMDDQS